MAFTPPTRSELAATIGRALRDTNGSVFPAASISDFIGLAIADLSAYRPKEVFELSVWPMPTDPRPFEQFSSIWSVTVRFFTGDIPVSYVIPHDEANSPGGHRAGWAYYGGLFMLSEFWTTRFDAVAATGQAGQVVVFGYADRDIPISDSEVLDLTDATDYLCVVAHCKSQGFELLTHDRALYQQWLAATNNTDVSPTQLSGMLSLAESTYQRLRARNTKLRRVASVDHVTAY